MRDYYAVLEVKAGATTVQIRRAYQRLARRYSPDVNFWERDARSLFEEIAEAYRILSDATARSLYDRQGARPAGPVGPDPSAASRPGRRGGDAHVAVELSFAQAVAGVEADVPVDRLTPCEACRATGAAPGVQPTTCSHCGGLGTVWSEGSRDWLVADRLSLILMRAGDPLSAAAVLEHRLGSSPIFGTSCQLGFCVRLAVAFKVPRTLAVGPKWCQAEMMGYLAGFPHGIQTTSACGNIEQRGA